MNKKWLVLWVLFPLFIYGQHKEYFNLKTKYIQLNKPVIQIDSFSIQPFYFEVFNVDNQIVNKNKYKVDFVKARLYWLDLNELKNQKLRIQYLVYPPVFLKSYQRFNPEVYRKDSLLTVDIEPVSSHRFKPFEGLTTRGSISRGIQAGNNQSLVMQSGLDLKIEGKLSEKVSVKAVLSDDNMPQAYAGISQSYKEFDRIYMQISAPKWQVTGGDIMMKNHDNYFIKFLRKTQGIELSIGKDSSMLSVAGGYVEGQFAINRFNGIEGNQGPYLLKGNKGENYIFVIPQSEKIYVNGKLLQSGTDKDYIINYETAELIFNPTFPITQNQRIVVEFNYANQHYVRYLNHNTYRHKGKKLDYQIFSYFEIDNKYRSLLFEPDAQQTAILKNAGDNLQNMWVTSAKETTFSEQKILYKKIFASPEYFQFTTLNEPPLYEVKFSFVGKNKGSYRIQKIVANGKIYEYVGLHNGDYEPVIKLSAPQSKKYAGVVLHYHPNDKTDIQIETLMNDNDKNLFSTKDDTDNLGNAFHLLSKQRLWHHKDKSLEGFLNYDYTHRQFETLDPFRSPEFLRQWQIDTIYGKQHLLDAGIDFSHPKHKVNSGFRFLQLRDTLSAKQAYWQADGHFNKLQYKSDWHYTMQKNNYDLHAFYGQQSLAYTFDKILLRLTAHYEDRVKKQLNIQDTLNYKYQFVDFQISRKDTERLSYTLFYKREQNDSVFHNRFNRVCTMDNFGFSLKKQGNQSRIELFAQYRISQYYAGKNKKDFLNLKAVWQQNYFKHFIETLLRIESFNANTLRNEVVFVETPPGQGVYLWNDYNGNGIQEINEFEIAVYSDQANYIRVVLPGQKYIKTLNNSYVAQLIVNPAVWQKKSFFKRFYAVFQFNTHHQTKQNNNFPLVWQPQEALEQNTLWQQDWFLNRSHKKYKIHFTYRFLQQKQLLLVGRQAHNLEQYVLHTEHRFYPGFIWHQEFSKEWNNNSSEDYSQKNYRLYNRSLQEKLAFKQGKNQKISLYYRLKLKENRSSPEKLKMHKLGLSYFYQNQKDNILNLDLQFIKNNLEGNPNTPVAFQMLEALQPGRNLVLTALWRQKINSYLVMNLNYNFRLSENNPAIHTGGVQLKMFF